MDAPWPPSTICDEDLGEWISPAVVYDSLRLKNTIQVIGLCLYNVGMLIYSSIQYEQITIHILSSFENCTVEGRGVACAAVVSMGHGE